LYLSQLNVSLTNKLNKNITVLGLAYSVKKMYVM
jgi:hypothetical protein